MHSGGFELTKLTYTTLEDNLIRHRGATGSTYLIRHRGDRQYLPCPWEPGVCTRTRYLVCTKDRKISCCSRIEPGIPKYPNPSRLRVRWYDYEAGRKYNTDPPLTHSQLN